MRASTAALLLLVHVRRGQPAAAGVCRARASRAAGPHAVVHLGPAKTGSTHIQSFFAANVAGFHAHGWAYPFLFGSRPCALKTTVDKNGYALAVSLNGAPGTPDEHSEYQQNLRAGLLMMARAAVANTSWCPRLDVATRRAVQGATTVLGVTALVKRWWVRQFARLANASLAGGAKSLLLSDEVFGSIHDPGKRNPCTAFLAPSLRAAGFVRRTAVLMYRTPVVSHTRSLFNQAYQQGNLRGVMLKRDVALRGGDFNATAPRQMVNFAKAYRRMVGEWGAAGFEVVVVDLAGVAAAGLDEADAVACEVMGLPCTAEGKWAAGATTKDKPNARQSAPDRTPAVAAAFYRWESGRREQAKCAVPEQHLRVGPFFDALAKELAPLLTAADEVCTDYTELEARALAANEATLDAAACVLHRVAGRVPAPAAELTYCSLDTGRVAGRRDVAKVFARHCAGEGTQATHSV